MPDEGANYALDSQAAAAPMAAPQLAYRPREVELSGATIGLIGCGGIAATHLEAYQRAGFQVRALCDRTPSKAESYRERFFPRARVVSDYREVLADPGIRFVDLTPYPRDRLPLIRAAIQAGKHVLSQKPFVADLEEGRELVELAEAQGVKLAVNQNGRWAPHFAYAREAARQGLLGEITAIRQAVRWDHNWIRHLPFNRDPHIILHDFGIHWFDFVVSVLGTLAPLEVTASTLRSPGQLADPHLLAQVSIVYPHTLVSLAFDADTRYLPSDETTLIGTQGTLSSRGPSLNVQRLTLATAAGICEPELSGQWFPDGFHGAMAELIWAADHDAEPLHGARENLASLALCQQAIAASQRSGR